MRRTADRTPRIALLVGFLALTFGIVRAHGSPASGYELSIYRATPTAVWAGIGVALVVAVGIAVSRYRDGYGRLALVLGGSGVLAVVSLPVIRGYHFYGLADSLTHLGWTREILARARSPLELIYPASHLLAGAVSKLAAVDLTRAMLLVVPVFVLLYFVFVTLSVRRLAQSREAAVAGAFVAFALLPIFNVGTALMFVPFTFGMLFAAFFLYLLVRYVESSPARRWPPTALDGLLLVAGSMLLLLHSQVFVDLLVLLAAIVLVQVLVRWTGRGGPIARHRGVGAHFLVLGALFVLWNANHAAIRRTVDQILGALSNPGSAGAVVQQQGASLAAIGVGLPEMFAKLFLVNVVVAAFVVWLIVASLRGSRVTTRAVDAWVVYLTVGGTFLAVFAVLHFFGAVSTYFFRHLGVGMVVLSILGGVAIYLAGTAIRAGGLLRTPVAGAAVMVALVLSLAIVFPSPYIYNPSYHVTEAQLSGHETVFENRAEGVAFSNVRGGVERYGSAYPGIPEPSADMVLGEDIRAGLPSEFDVDHYLVVTDTDRLREIESYRELRVTREDFRTLSSQQRISRIGTNHELDLYYVEGNGTA